MKPFHIVGILNVTQNSFYDGGKFAAFDDALRQAEKLLRDGADIIDIGGQSSLNAEEISADEERRRVIPLVQALHREFPGALLSADTMRSAVASDAIAAGAGMINDVSAGRKDPGMFGVLAGSSADFVLMYSKDVPPTLIAEKTYDDVVGTVFAFLQERAAAALAAGVRKEKIIVDPGLGFFIGTDPAYSLRILAKLDHFRDLGFPVYVSPSRKSFLAGREKLPPADRLPGTMAASVIAILNGASYIRTHDVLEVRRACEIAQAVREIRG